MPMYDVECPACRHTFGWAGAFAPLLCPKCGHQIPDEALARDLAEIEHTRKAIRMVREARANKDRAALLRAIAFAEAPAGTELPRP